MGFAMAASSRQVVCNSLAELYREISVVELNQKVKFVKQWATKNFGAIG
jgi:hypothetical protein